MPIATAVVALDAEGMTNTCVPTFTLARVVFTRPSMTTVEEFTAYVSVAPVLLWIVTDEPERAVTTPDAGVTCTAGVEGFETRVAGDVAVVVAAGVLAIAAVAVCGGCDATLAMATPLPRATSAIRVLPPTRRTNLNLDVRYTELPTFTLTGSPEMEPSLQAVFRNSCGLANASLRKWQSATSFPWSITTIGLRR